MKDWFKRYTGLLRSFNAPPKKRTKPKGYKPGSWFKVKAAASDSEPYEILIYGEIGAGDWFTQDGVEAKAFAQELKKIPANRDVLLRINSPGGSVWDGLAIHNTIKSRGNVDAIVDGVAFSIASVIACGARKLTMPRNALFMIHDPWGFAQGNADDMRQAAKTLDAHRDAIATVYQDKTGAALDEVKAWMAEESYYTGEEARNAGFADEVAESVSFNIDKSALTRFGTKAFQAAARASDMMPSSSSAEDPDAMMDSSSHSSMSESSVDASTTNSARQRISAASGGQQKDQDSMNRAKIIAMLKKLGVKVDDNATDEQLLALLEQELAKRNDSGSGVGGAGAPGATQPPNQQTPPPANNTPPAGQQGAAQNVVVDFQVFQTQMAEYRKQLDEEKKAREVERKARITAVVQRCVDEDRIPQAQLERWVERAMADERVLEDIQAMEPRPPGANPVRAVVIGDSVNDVTRAMTLQRRALDSFMRGNDVTPQALRDAAIVTAQIINANRKKLDQVLAANTIDTNLKRVVILNDILRDFKRRLLILSVFSTRFNNVPLEGTDEVVVPFYALDTTASTDYVAATGYTFAANTDVGSRKVKIDKRKYQTMDFSSDTFRRQPYFKPEVHLGLKAEQLAVDIWTNILSIITEANYGVTVFNEEPGQFDSDDVATLKGKAEKADWPSVGRALVLSTDHEVALGQDDYIKSALHSGSTQTLREGSVGRLYGFDTYFSPRIPNNSEDLSGFICLPQAALVATSPVMPAPGVRQKLLRYEIVIDPDTGIAFEYRYGADEWTDRDREVVECNYGFAKGNGSALKRITAGASEQSSSSSASSVNSSSSSSSSPSY